MTRNRRAWVTASQCNDLTSVTAEGAGQANALATVPLDAGPIFGGQTRIKMTSAGNSAQGSRIPINVASSGKVRIHVYVETLGATTTNIGCTLYAANAANLNNRYQKYLRLGRGMNTLTLSREYNAAAGNQEACWNATNGSPNWASNLQSLRLDVDAGGSGVSTVAYLCGVEVDGYDFPILAPTIDDAWASVPDAQAIADTHGVRMTLYVITDYIDTNPAYMTLAQLRAWHDAGHAIAAHTPDHLQDWYNQSARTQAEIEAKLTKCVNQLAAWGFTRKNEQLHFASPYGEHAQTAASTYRAAIKASGMLSATNVVTRLESCQPGDWHQVARHPVNHYNGGVTDTATYSRLFKQAIGGGGVYAPLYHKFVSGSPADALEVQLSAFETECKEWSAAMRSGLIENLTIPEWYERMTV